MANSFLTLAIGGGLAAIGIAVIGYTWLTGIARNPEAADKMFTPGIIAVALCEFVALLCFVIAFLEKGPAA
jgi:F-type H+-transporting ATPase subunit c